MQVRIKAFSCRNCRVLKPRLIAELLVVCLSPTISAAQPVLIESFQLPQTVTDQNNFKSYVLPNINGLTVPLNWSDPDDCSTILPCSQVLGGAYTWPDLTLSTYTSGTQCSGSKQCVVNFEVNVASGTGQGYNSATPAYVFSSSWTSHCCGSSPLVDVCFCGVYKGNPHQTNGRARADPGSPSPTRWSCPPWTRTS